MKIILSLSLACIFLLSPQLSYGAELDPLKQSKQKRGIVLIADKDMPNAAGRVLAFGKDTKFTIYFQSPNSKQILAVR